MQVGAINEHIIEKLSSYSGSKIDNIDLNLKLEVSQYEQDLFLISVLKKMFYLRKVKKCT